MAVCVVVDVAGVVTTMSTAAPTVPGGVNAVIVWASTTTTLVAAAPPNVTLVAPVKLVPLMVTGVFPWLGPEGGETDVKVGAGWGGVTGCA